MSFTYRENQNTPLTWAQLDGNFREVDSVQRKVSTQVMAAAASAESAAAASTASQSSAELAEEMARISVVRWCGNHEEAPSTRLDGSPLQISDEYGNLSDNLRYNWTGTSWVALNSSAQQLEERLSAQDGASIIGGASMTVSTQAQLRMMPTNRSSKYATILGDGFVSFYILNLEDSSSSDDNGSVITPNNGPGRWKLNHNGRVSVKQWGLKGDGNPLDYNQFQAALDYSPGLVLEFPNGVYLKDKRNRIHGGAYLFLHPKAVIRRFGQDDGWMFVNGEVGNTEYATLYDGDGDITIEGGQLDLGGYLGRSAAAAIIGHSRRVTFKGVHLINGWESHNIEINSSADFFFLYCIFEDQGFDPEKIASSFECVNVDYASPAGFPGFGVWDNTPCRTGLFLGCIFRNVHSSICSHSVPVGGRHHRISVIDCVHENIATRPLRLQGWDECNIRGGSITNAGYEAITIISGNRNKVSDLIIRGASTAANGQYSAIRIEGDLNEVYDVSIDRGGYANTYAYPIVVASGNRNRIELHNCEPGLSGPYLDSGTLTSIDGLTLLYSGNSGITPGTVLALLDSVNNYDHLQVSCGAVSGGLYQTGIARPFARRKWAVGVDFVAVPTAQGRLVASVTALNSLTLTSASDTLRQIYGVS